MRKMNAFGITAFVLFPLLGWAETPRPVIRSITPQSGPTSGGMEILLRGLHFDRAAEVAIGGVRCQKTFWVDSDQITCITPPHAAGISEILLTNPDKQSDIWHEAFIYGPVMSLGQPKKLTVDASVRLQALNATPPVSFSVISGQGKVDPDIPSYIAPSIPTVAIVRATDAAGRSAEVTMSVYARPVLVPDQKTIPSGWNFKFSLTGGAPPFRFSLKSGPGSVDPETGMFQSDQLGESVVSVKDGVGNESEAKVTTVVEVSLKDNRVTAGRSKQLEFSGGVPPYRFSMISGLGSIDESSGIFQAGNEPGTATIEVRDSAGARTEFELIIFRSVQLVPAAKTIFTKEVRTLSATDGILPYQFSLVSGRGWVNPETGTYLSPDTPTVASVRVVDADGNTAESQITVFAGQVHRSLAGGYGHTCAVSRDRIRCWGSNKYGQLGDGTTHSSAIPVVAGTEKGVLSVTAGALHSCALVDWSVYCWGDNRFGQLGVSGIKQSTRPLIVPGLERGVTAIASGAHHNCAIKAGAVYCWGSNDHGQLGVDPSRKLSLIPLLAVPRGARAITAGLGHSCATMEKGALCWGQNSAGQLGNGTLKDSYKPVEVKSLNETIMAVEAGGFHTCALLNGSVRCWGFNGMGAIGRANENNYTTPQEITELNGTVRNLTAGMYHSCAIHEERVRCWGMNKHGQLGINSVDLRALPTDVKNLTGDIETVAAGSEHTCAMNREGVRCWGSNEYGQLGQPPTKNFPVHRMPQHLILVQ